MKQLDSGSSNIKVKFFLASFIERSSSKNALNFTLVAESPFPKGFVESKCSTILSSNPSIVVYTLPKVPGCSSKPSSGIAKYVVSDLKISRFKSSAVLTTKVIFVALADIPPPYLISVLLCPHYSHENAIMIISLKKGIVAIHILHSPSAVHA